MNNNEPTQERAVLETDHDTADALLSRWSDDENPSDNSDEATVEDSDKETADDQLNESEDDTEVSTDENDEDLEEEDSDNNEEEETEEEEIESEVLELDDDTEVEILVDGESKQASIKSLKRLYGQEASLTRKSQELATQRKNAEEAIGKTNVIMQKMLEKAEERMKPYREVDMLVASKTMSNEDFALLRKEASEAEDNLRFLQQEANQFYTEMQAQHQKAMQEQAQNCVKVLQEKIPNWNNKLYDDIREYAVSTGIPEDRVNMIVDPSVIMMLNKARLFDEGKKVATTKRKKVVKAKKVLKSTKASKSVLKDKKTDRNAIARQKLRSGDANDFDNIADAILSRWQE